MDNRNYPCYAKNGYRMLTLLVNINSFSYLFLVAAYVCVSTIIILLKRHTSSLPVFFFLVLLLLILGNSISMFFTVNATTGTAVRFWNQWDIFTQIMLAPVSLLFMLVYTGAEKRLRTMRSLLFIFLPAILLLYFAWNTDFLINYRHALITPWGYQLPQTTLGNLVFTVYRLLYNSIGIILLVLFYRRATNPDRRIHTAIIMFAYYLPVFVSLILTTIAPAAFRVTVFPMDDIFMAAGILFITYAFLKYGVALLNPATLSEAIFDMMSEAVIAIDRASLIIFLNKSAEKLLQTNARQLIGQPLSKLFPTAQEYTLIKNNLLLPLRTQNFLRLEEVTLQKNAAEKVSVAISATKIRSDDEQTTEYVLILSDLGKVKNYQLLLEEKLHEIQMQNNKLDALQEELQKDKVETEAQVQKRLYDMQFERNRWLAAINNLPLGFIMTDTDKNILLANKAIKDIFYLVYPESNIILQDIQNHIHGIHLGKQIDLVIKGRKQIHMNNVQVDNKFVSLFISPIPVAGLTKTDVTGAVIMVADSSTMQTNLASNEDAFAIASHELRTPLSAIRGYLALIKQFYFDKLPDEQLKQMLTDIDISSSRLLAIINDFLDTTKLEQGKMEVKKEPCEMIAIVQSAIKETQSLALQKKLYLKLDSPTATVQVLGDKDRLKQILINLISNAMRFTIQGGITIKVEPAFGEFVKVLVSDTGKGISSEGQKVLFHKFQQVAGESYAKQSGTGLGLYISKLLIEKMGGTIQLEHSEINKGSTFSFTVPALQ